MVDLLLKIVACEPAQTLFEILGAELLYFFFLHNRLHVLGWVVVTTNDELCGDGGFCAARRSASLATSKENAFELDENTSGSHRRHESFGVTFTFTHSHFGGLLGDRLVGEYADPHLALTLHVAACNGDTCGLNLSAGDPFPTQVVLMPNEPKASWLPRWALPFMRPFWERRNLVFLGCNIVI